MNTEYQRKKVKHWFNGTAPLNYHNNDCLFSMFVSSQTIVLLEYIDVRRLFLIVDNLAV